MKKTHDATSLANELEGSSAYFQSPPPVAPPLPPTEPAPLPAPEPHPVDEAAAHRPPVADRPSDRSDDRPAVQPAGRSMGKRPTQRRAFEFYRDQLETLKVWSALEMAEGGEGNMSVWARQAFDDFIARREGTERTTDRTTDRSVDRRTG